MNFPKLIEDYRLEVDKHYYKVNGIWIWPLQNTFIFPLFKTLFEQYNIIRIIEIGTAFGGLPILLRTMGFSGDIITFNNHDELTEDIRGLFNQFNITQQILDVFVREKDVSDIIRKDGQTLLICDGGNKAKEFNTFAPHLKQNDIIMAHDYCYSVDLFNSNVKNFWEACDIFFKDLNCSDISSLESETSERAAFFIGKKL